MAEETKVGLIGAGIMGKGLGRNLLQAGYSLSVTDTDPAAVDRMTDMGASAANGIAGLASSCGIVATCMPSLGAIQAVFEGEDGIIANAEPGTVVIDFSTSDPNLTRNLAEKAAARDVTVIDAPMLRMEQNAWDGTLVLLVGGDAAVVERCDGIFRAVSERYFHCGDVGAGHTFKLLNNINGLAMHAVYCETFTLARKLGMDLNRLLEVLQSGMSGSTILNAVSQRVVTGDEGPVFATDVALKDATLFTRLAEDTGSPALVAGAARSVYQLTSMQGYGGEDIVNIGTALREIAAAEKT